MVDYEYEDDFAYAHFLYEFITFDKKSRKKNKAILSYYEKALEGDYDARYNICIAFLNRDQKKFDNSFYDLLEYYESQNSKIADPKLDSVLAMDYTFEPNRRIYVEGLGILRIADKLGIKTEQEYKNCPGIARVYDFEPYEAISFPNLEWETEY